MTYDYLPYEYDECVIFTQWLDANRLSFSHIASGTHTKSWNVKRKNKALGVKKGLPDYIIVAPQGLLFIEMKRTKRSQLSPEQYHWIYNLNKCNGVEAKVCKGADEAISFVSQFL